MISSNPASPYPTGRLSDAAALLLEQGVWLGPPVNRSIATLTRTICRNESLKTYTNSKIQTQTGTLPQQATQPPAPRTSKCLAPNAQKRVLAEGLFYHVTSRANYRARFFGNWIYYTYIRLSPLRVCARSLMYSY